MSVKDLKFKLGDRVRSKSNPSRKGAITGIDRDADSNEICWDDEPGSLWSPNSAIELIDTFATIDPKKSCADKKLTFDSVPITLQVLAAPANQSGANKYGAWNWLKLPDGSMSLNTYLNALQRHLILFRAGQDYTSDTNIHNLDSMIAGLAVVRDAMIFGKVQDDRIKLSDDQIKILEALLNREG